MDARRIAYTVLVRVDQGGAFANRALDAAISEAGQLDPRDVAFATELVYGTLRRQPFIDHALRHFSHTPLEELDAKTRALLRLGAHQVLHLRVPDHASVHATVELAKTIREGRATKLVNAVLRAIARAKDNILVPPEAVDPVNHLALTESFPPWLVERMLAAHGFEETKARLVAMNRTAPFTVRVNVRRGDRAAATHALKAACDVDALPTRFSPVGLTLEGVSTSLALVRDAQGRWQAQDEAAQLVGLFAAPAPGMTVLDACAAPGGKTTHLAELMDDQGRLDAVDVHKGKMRDIDDAAQKLGLSIIRSHAADATLPLPFAPPEGYDLVLVDAPCSGLGTVRRHPELKTRRTAEDVTRLAALQAQILDNVAGVVKPGGLLVYATCTFVREECEDQVARFLARHPAFARAAPPDNGLDWSALVNAQGELVLDAHHHGTDGFFAARLVRKV